MENRQDLPLVNCPHCGTPQVLVCQQLHWPQGWKPGDSTEGIYYECCECRTPIHESDRPRLNALYLKSFPEVVEAFLTARDDPEKMKFFVENWLGNEWIDLPPLGDDRQRPTVIRKDQEPLTGRR